MSRYLIQHSLECTRQVAAVGRAQSVEQLGGFRDRITVVAGPTDDGEDIYPRTFAAKVKTMALAGLAPAPTRDA